MRQKLISDAVEEHTFLVRRFFERSSDTLIRASDALLRSLRNGGKVLIAGNGGSAADAQHFAAELTGRFEKDRPAIAAIALTTDTSALTAIGNDFGFEYVFARQVEALASRGDVLILISTSGSSQNLLEAARSASARGLTTIGLLGRDGGAVRDLVDHALVVEGKKTSRIQEIHGILVHLLCESIERELFAE